MEIKNLRPVRAEVTSTKSISLVFSKFSTKDLAMFFHQV